MIFWVSANLQRIGYAMKFSRYNNGPLSSRTGLVEPVPNWSWQLFWMNHHYGQNVGSLIGTKLEIPIKWMEESRFSSSKESAPYTMYFEGDVHCGIRHWWGSTAPCCTSKADGKWCLLRTFLKHHLHPALRRKQWHLVIQNPIILHDNARSHTTVAVMDLLHRWQWQILEHPPYSPDESMPVRSLCQSQRSTARDRVQHRRWTYPWYRVIDTKH